MWLKHKQLGLLAGALQWLIYFSMAESHGGAMSLASDLLRSNHSAAHQLSTISLPVEPKVEDSASASPLISSAGSSIIATTPSPTPPQLNPIPASPQVLDQQPVEAVQHVSLSTNSQPMQQLGHQQQVQQQSLNQMQQHQDQKIQQQMVQFQNQVVRPPQQQQQQQQQAQLEPIPMQPVIHNGQMAMQMARHGQLSSSQSSQPQQHPVQQASYSSQSASAQANSYPTSHHPMSPLYLGHNPFIEILRPFSYADDNIVTLNLSHSHIYEIDSDAFVGQRFEHIDLSNNKLGLIHRHSFRIGPIHSRHNPYNPNANSSSKQVSGAYPTRRPPPTHPNTVTIDFSHNPAIVALSGAFDHIDVPNCLLNFTNSTVELKFGAFKKYFKEHPGHMIDIESVDCCEQEWLLGYKHNFVARTHCDHDHNLVLSKFAQQAIIDSCIAYVTSGRHSMTMQGPSMILRVVASPKTHTNSHVDNQTYLTYLILGGTAMILTSLSIYIIFYMFSLKAAFVGQLQNKS